MEVNDFIKEHIVIDEREIISKKLKNLSKKYLEFGSYLDLVQKEVVRTIFKSLKSNKVIYAGFFEDIEKHKISYYLKKLLAEDFICETETIPHYLEQDLIQYYGEANYSKMTFYKLSKKGIDFINIDYIREYLENEF